MSSSFLQYKHATWSPDEFTVPLSKLPNGTLQEVNLMKWFVIVDARTVDIDKVSAYIFALCCTVVVILEVTLTC